MEIIVMVESTACYQVMSHGRFFTEMLLCNCGRCDVLTVCKFPDDFVNHNNIRNLSGCTVVQGHLKILDSAFDGYVCLIRIDETI